MSHYCAATGGQSTWLPPGGGASNGGAEDDHLPDRQELVMSTFRRLFPHSFVGVAAVHKHKVGPPSCDDKHLSVHG